MRKVVTDISMSLDGYVTAVGADLQHGLGVGGELLHRWVEDGNTEADRQILAATFADSGSVIMGRNTFDVVDGPDGWSDEMGYGATEDPTNPPPIFVVTHTEPGCVRLAGRFTFVTDGVASAVRQARAAAGDRDVFVMGGAGVIDQCIAEGLADEVRIHLSPVLLGGGTRLFANAASGPTPLQIERVVDTPTATHLTYRLAPPEP